MIFCVGGAAGGARRGRAAAMGCAASKRCAELREESAVLKSKVHALEEEVRRERCERAAKEGAWRRERRRQEGEMAALRKKLGEEERRRRELEEESAAAGDGGGEGLSKEELQVLSACRLVEQMKAEQERREQAVEKWKQLYLAIKAELDALILRTKEGDAAISLTLSSVASCRYGAVPSPSFLLTPSHRPEILHVRGFTTV